MFFMEALGFNLGQEADLQTLTAEGVAINNRQLLVLNRLVDGFAGKLTTSKYAQIRRVFTRHGLRDILPLVERGILLRNPEGGRSTSYQLAPRL